MSTKTPEQRAQERIASEQYWATPEGRAVKRWPADKSMDGRTNLTLTKRNLRQGYATAIREEVEPRDRLLQEIVKYAEHAPECSKGKMDGVNYDLRRVEICDCGLDPILAKAKEQFGITPTP